MELKNNFFNSVNVGDIISDSIHYTFLAGAVFFIVRGKKGKATLICDKLVTLYDGSQEKYNTKILYCNPTIIDEKNVIIRCGKNCAKYERFNNLSIGYNRYTGSMFD